MEKRRIGSPRFLAAFFLSVIPIFVSGCANMLYTPMTADLNDSDSSGCDRQALEDNLIKSCRRLSSGSPVASRVPFANVISHISTADPYKLSQKPSTVDQFFFELTPLGIIAPFFNYPPRETVYTGRVEFSFAPAEAAERGASKFEFRVKAGETFTKKIEFSRKSGKEPNSSVSQSAPDSIEIGIRCRPLGCTLTSTPPVVSPDGVIQFQSL